MYMYICVFVCVCVCVCVCEKVYYMHIGSNTDEECLCDKAVDLYGHIQRFENAQPTVLRGHMYGSMRTHM